MFVNTSSISAPLTQNPRAATSSPLAATSNPLAAPSSPLAATSNPLPTPSSPLALAPHSPAGFPFARRRLSLGDATISYVDERPLDGSVDAPTLLLVHGTPTWSYLWRAPIAELRRTHRVIALDLPGFGDSTAPLSGGHAFSVGARLIAAFIERLGLRNLVVVMHATAGPMAIGAALADPARVRGLVITNSFAWPLLGSPGKLGKIARLVSSRFFAWFGVQSGLLGWITARFSRRNGRFSLEERRAIAAPLARRSVRAHLADVLASLRGDDRHLATLERDVGRSLAHIPALLLYGMHDNGYRAGFLARWQSLLPIHQVVLLERAGHFPPEDQPQEWTDAVTDFVARL